MGTWNTVQSRANVPSSITELAASQRASNARRITATLTLLGAVGTLVSLAFGAPMKVDVVLILATAGKGVAYWLVLRRRTHLGVACALFFLLVEHVGVVAVHGQLGPVPYIAPIVLLLAAATLQARWLVHAFALTIAAQVTELLLSPMARQDQIDVVTACLITVAVFVVSMLHVRGIERAFSLAEARDRARADADAVARQSEQRYRLIADNTDDLIGLLDSEGRALYLSPSHQRLLGVDPAQNLGRQPHEFLSIDNLERARAAFRQTLKAGEARVEIQLSEQHGKGRVFDSVMKRIASDAEVLVVVASRDVTERRLLQERLLASERLESLGRLAGSVAHDFNNLLTVIGCGAELARSAAEGVPAATREIDTILSAAESASKLTRQLLSFSKKQLLVRSELDLSTALEEQREILQRMVGKDITLECDFEKELPAVNMPRPQLEQLTMNLAVNARDAMPQGGRLKLGLRKRTLEQAEGDAPLPGDYVELSVSDSGCGIPEEVLPKLFEPLFTTKGDAGTGLGLATCKSIVTQLGGSISVSTSTGVGTTFTVLLPASKGSPASTATDEQRTSVHRVLVVDDERAVLDTTARMLRSAGYDVIEAATFADAKRILNNQSISLDAMITDVVLSGDRGTDLLQYCREQRPQARVVVMSGYTPDPGAAQRLVSFRARFLPKPFGREQLLAALLGGANGAKQVDGRAHP